MVKGSLGGGDGNVVRGDTAGLGAGFRAGEWPSSSLEL